MNKYVLFLIFSGLLAVTAQAQNVTIPNAKFKAALIGNEVDKNKDGEIQVSEAAVVTGLNVGNQSITDLTGIEAFTALTILYCYRNALTTLDLSKNTALSRLDCSDNRLTALDLSNNTALTYFNCNNNQLTTLDLSKNTALTQLSFDYSKLTTIDLSKNIALTRIDCFQNQLTSLDLSKNTALIFLSCPFNQLTSLDLSKNIALTNVSCNNNQLTDLYLSKNTTLTFLRCDFNNLTTLDVSKSIKLATLICHNNQLNALDVSKNTDLNQLKCYSNPLTCLSYLPSSLLTLLTDVKCLPNKPSKMIMMNSTGLFVPLAPLCNPTNNNYHCNAFPIISGRVFIDENKNGRKEASELYHTNVKVIIQPKGNYTFTNDSGYYELAVDTLGTYTVSTTNPRYYTSLPSPQLVSISTYDQAITQDFALQAINIKDIGVNLTALAPARPGFKLPILVEVTNQGNVAGDVNAAFNSYAAPTFILDSTSSPDGTSLYYKNLLPGQKVKMMVYGRLATTTQLGDTITFRGDVNVYESGIDSNYSNNFHYLTLTVRGSYDPNDKLAVEKFTTDQLAKGEYLDYTIRFQNTGTDTAFTVVIADTLSSKVDAGSLEVLGTSHLCKTTVNGNKVYFEFLNILLLDSNANEKASHGYVKYRVKPKSTLFVNDQITNKASIYFDYNLPVVTNITVTTVVFPSVVTGMEEAIVSQKTTLYPNPTKDEATLIFPQSGSYELTLSDLQGKSVKTWNDLQGSQANFSLEGIGSGMYVYTVQSKDGQKTIGKLVVNK
jgi:uncharacterized repeat protein (TIGR01451 family)